MFMMKYALLILFIPCFGFSQILLEGSVVGNNEPLQNASVYLDNTTLGTITDLEGKFELQLPKGTYDLVISYLGFNTKSITINSDNITGPLHIKLSVATNMLEEVVLKSIKYDDEWQHNLSRFKNAFIGRSANAYKCKILNPKVLSFEYDRSNDVLKADAYSKLQIVNEFLGYQIEYELADFHMNNRAITYLGRSKFIPMKGGKAKQRKWARNRAMAFFGSKNDFVQALRSHRLGKKGFLVHQFRRVKNPERPSEQQLKIARYYIRNQKSSLDFSRNIKTPRTKLDSMIVISKKSSLPKHIDYLYKSNVPYKDLMHSRSKDSILAFKDYLSIIYTKEKESLHYVNSNWSRKNKRRGPQSSTMVLLKSNAIMDPSGDIIDPLDVMVEGYWSYEGFAETLPRDYMPPKE